MFSIQHVSQTSLKYLWHELSFFLETNLRTVHIQIKKIFIIKRFMYTAQACPKIPLLGASNLLYVPFIWNIKLPLFLVSFYCVQDLPGLDCGAVRGPRLVQERGH
jgi:hypothetical protein